MKRKQIQLCGALLTLSIAYACLECFGALPQLRQTLIMPLCTILDILGVGPWSSEAPTYLQPLDVDVDGFVPSTLRLAVFVGLIGTAIGLRSLWQRVPHRWSIIASKRSLLSVFWLAMFLTCVFIVYSWIVISKSLFCFWEPGILGEDVYFSVPHIVDSFFVLLGPLWWITLPLVLLLSYLWGTIIHYKRSPMRTANKPSHRTVASRADATGNGR